MDQNSLFVFGTIVLMALLAAPSIVLSIRGWAKSDRMIQRLERAKDRPVREKSDTPAKKSVSTVIAEIGRRATPGNEEQLSAIRFKLLRGGFLHPNAVSVYFAARLLSLFVPQILILVFFRQLADYHEFGPLIGCVVLALIGLMLPEWYVSSATKKLETEYREGFPDMMDLMVACVEAGMSIDAAVTRVAEELVDRYPNLAMHLNIIALELRAGRSRHDAWKNFASRLGLEAADSLATMLRQAEEMGTSVGQTLRVFSKDMRQKRMLAAEEQALALSAKLTVPLIVFVFPTLLGVLIMPAIVQAMQVFPD
ncbi:MAG: type II secretion system F family protein [Pseudomonadota bacterium]